LVSPVIPVILAGGVGSRLWPISRTYYPKQFHQLLDDKSFIQSTALRAQATTDHPPIVVCNEEHRFMVAEQLRAVGIEWHQIILEPEGRNSAPAIALAACCALQSSEDALLLVLPSDHLVNDEQAFKAAVEEAAQGASEGGLVTFGVTPSRAETGYGYIEVAGSGGGLQAVTSFVEKPKEATAQEYLEAGNFLWNSGMFVLGAKNYMSELAVHNPKMASCCQVSMDGADRDLDFLRPTDAFLDSPSDSIDFAVMEKTEHAMVVPVNFGWNDIGSWDAIFEELEKDAAGNHLRGDVIAVDTTNTLVIGGDRMIGTLGIDNVVVVETSDAVLVADRDRVQDVKIVVNRLAEGKRNEQHYHREVFRPWGSYEGLNEGERYQVKCIKVKPGASLSLQLHHHRSEHWVVVKGTGRITRGEDVFTLGENESTYIPRGVKHRLENPGKLELELIEVQVGSYLGEDDIERFEDIYGR
jgi:mannose-1-phosphate guanylyltransferase/mannose-6-phosphate isomerase